MLQRNRYAYGRQRWNLFLHHAGGAHFRLWWYESSDGAQRSPINYHRQMADLHFAGNIDVVSGIRPGKILAIFRESGKSSDGHQQHHHADLQADASRFRCLRCLFSRSWLDVHEECVRPAFLSSANTIQKARIRMQAVPHAPLARVC